MVELLKFIRFRICFLAIFIGLSGFLMFNEFSIPGAVLATLSVFSLCACCYGYNRITDKSEDLINEKEANSWAFGRGGYPLVSFFLITGLCASFLLSGTSFVYSSVFTLAAFIYSFFRVKRFTILKNAYTAVFIGFLFLTGAGKLPSLEILAPYAFIVSVIFTGSVLSDLRDYEGDKRNGVRTIPVSIGMRNARVLSASLVLFSVFLSVIFQALVVLPFMAITMLYILSGKYGTAHQCGGLSIVFLALWSVI